jgi:uncharacterized caspase-like protein
MRRTCLVLLLVVLPVPAFAEGKRPGSPSRQGPGSLYVLSIGINTYPGDGKLEYAVKDAKDIEQAFQEKSQSLFRRVETKLLTNREANRAGILDGLRWLKTETKPEDAAVIFYSGHGGNDQPVGFYLVPAGFSDRRWRKTMVSGQELREAVKEVPGRVVLLLDCCNAGGILATPPRTTSEGPRQTRSRTDWQSLLRTGEWPRQARSASERAGQGGGNHQTPGLVRELNGYGHGVMVLCAARPRETAQEVTRLHHGFLTRAVLEGLRGKADANNDGTITAGELDEYVVRRVRQLSKDEQHAVAGETRSIHSLPLAKP